MPQRGITVPLQNCKTDRMAGLTAPGLHTGQLLVEPGDGVLVVLLAPATVLLVDGQQAEIIGK